MRFTARIEYRPGTGGSFQSTTAPFTAKSNDAAIREALKWHPDAYSVEVVPVEAEPWSRRY